MPCGNLVCEVVFELVCDHHWGKNTIPIQALIGKADCDADFDEKERAFETAIGFNFVERVREDHVRISHTEELIQVLAHCGYAKIDIKPRQKRKYPSEVFDQYFD